VIVGWGKDVIVSVARGRDRDRRGSRGKRRDRAPEKKAVGGFVIRVRRGIGTKS